jgi:DNA-binding NarL/FixJ family response regulator
MGKLLFLSEKTIEIYRYNICKKLLLPARTSSLIHWVFDNKEVVAVL